MGEYITEELEVMDTAFFIVLGDTVQTIVPSELLPCSVMETHVPHFPTEEEFSQSMLASVNATDMKNLHYVLFKFALAYPRLKAGGALLPDLIEFYQWIHTELAYLVTYNYAQNHGLEEVITKADQKYEGLDLCQLYERVKGDCLMLCVFTDLLISEECSLSQMATIGMWRLLVGV